MTSDRYSEMFNFKYHSRFFGVAKKGKFHSNILLKLALYLFASQSHHAFCQAGDIRIKLKDIKTDKGGNLVICVFRGEDGFPADGSKALRVIKSSPRNEVIITEIPKGEYAVSLLHDIDGNGKMTYSFLGIPKDGFSSSPEGGPSLKKPDYNGARFLHDGKGITLELKVHYLP